MRNLFLSLLLLAWIAGANAQIVKGDMNDDGRITMQDANSIVNAFTLDAPLENLSGADNSLLIGKWYLGKSSQVEFFDDGTNTFLPDATYNYYPSLGFIVFTFGDKPEAVYNVNAGSIGKIVFVTPDGLSSISLYAYQPMGVGAGCFVEKWDGLSDIILGSVRESGDDYRNAYTWTENHEDGYGEENTSNPMFNVIIGTPSRDDSGIPWYSPYYNLFTSNDWVYGDTELPEFGNGNPGDVYVRRYFTTPAGAVLPEDIYMVAAHDDAPCEYYINGTKVWGRTGYEPGVDGWYLDEIVKLTPEQKKLIKTDGTVNVFAYHVHQNWGGRYADGGIYGGTGDVADAFNNNELHLRFKNALAQAEKTSGFDTSLLKELKEPILSLQDIAVRLEKTRFELRKRLYPHHDYSGMESTVPSDGVEVWIYNVGAGLFLAGGNDWGTHASLNYNMSCWPMVLHENLSGDNRYTIQTNLPNGVRGINDGLGHNGYVDCGPWDVDDEGWAWEIEPVGDGSYRIINCDRVGENIYLGMTEDSRFQVDVDKAGADNEYNHWKFFTRDQFEALLDNATGENGVDVTYMIRQNTFAQNDFDFGDKWQADATFSSSAWECNEGYVWNWKRNDVDGDYVYEAWCVDDDVILEQEITGLRNGWYQFSLQGFYRDGDYNSAMSGNSNRHAVLYVQTESETYTLPLASILGYANNGGGYGKIGPEGKMIPDNCRDAAKFFQFGQYRLSEWILLVNGSSLRIGIRRPYSADVKPGDWVVVDNFRLEYQGR